MVLWFSDSKGSYPFLPVKTVKMGALNSAQDFPKLVHVKCSFKNAAKNLTAQNAAEMGIDNTIQSQVGSSRSKLAV